MSLKEEIKAELASEQARLAEKQAMKNSVIKAVQELTKAFCEASGGEVSSSEHDACVELRAGCYNAPMSLRVTEEGGLYITESRDKSGAFYQRPTSVENLMLQLRNLLVKKYAKYIKPIRNT